MDLEHLEQQVRSLLAQETHPEAFFRALLVLTELGDITKYVTHDPKLNPEARPHGSREDEILALGQLIIQVISLAVAREISCEVAIQAAYRNWQDKDWQKKEVAAEGPVRGRTVVPGNVEGQAFVVTDGRRLEDFQQGILVAPFIQAKQTHFLTSNRPQALVTDSGGVMSHPAVIARELGIVTIVGTGNATQLIPHRAHILVQAENEEGIVEIVRN